MFTLAKVLSANMPAIVTEALLTLAPWAGCFTYCPSDPSSQCKYFMYATEAR